MASVYDNNFLTDEQKKQIDSFQAEWNRANAAGDQAAMDAAHAAAERVRAQAGYSGGENGGGYTGLGGGASAGFDPPRASSYSAAQLPSYQAQTDAVNRVYDAAREAQLAQLKSAYDQNNAVLEEQRAAIPEAYRLQRNETAAQSELAGRNFREYAAASGLASGAGGQAELARSNQLQGDLSALGRQETAEQRELESKIAQLKIQYQNDISAAIAQGEYERAAALLQEYQRAQESAVTTAQAQADENYRAWSAGYQQSRDAASDAQWRQSFDYQAGRDAVADAQWQQQFGYQQSRDSASDSQWQQSFDYQRERDSAADQLEEYQRQLQLAEFYAQYGDFSKLQELGVDTSAYEAQLARAGQSGSGYSGGGYSGGSSRSGSGSGTSGGEWVSDMARMEAAGVKSGADAYSWALANGFSSTEAKQLQANWEAEHKQPETYTGVYQKMQQNGIKTRDDAIMYLIAEQGMSTEDAEKFADTYMAQLSVGRGSPVSGNWDMDGDSLKVGSPAHTLYGLLTHTPMPYDEMIDRIEAAYKSGEISEEAARYLSSIIDTSGRGYNR